MKSHYYKISLPFFLFILLLSCNRHGKFQVARVRFEYYGDFGTELSELTIFDSNGIKKAVLATSGVSRSEIIVDSRGEQAFQKFLKGLKSAETADNCTSEQYCTVYTKNEKIENRNITCRWKGFEELKSALFKSH